MNKATLADKIAAKTGISSAQAEDALNAFVTITIDELKNAGEVTLAGFGTFSARRRKGREGINPRRPAEKITIPSVVVAKFKAGKNLKDALKGKGKYAEPSAAPAPVATESPAAPTPSAE